MPRKSATTEIARRTILGGAASMALSPSWVLAQPKGIPVIGFLNSFSPEESANRLAAFQQGLNDEGFVEGRNVMIEYR